MLELDWEDWDLEDLDLEDFGRLSTKLPAPSCLVSLHLSRLLSLFPLATRHLLHSIGLVTVLSPCPVSVGLCLC